MKTWLFTWNRERWSWDDELFGYKELKEDIRQEGHAFSKWTCGVNKSIKAGDRIFLIKLGSAPKGIVASGYAVTGVFEGTHWDSDKKAEGKKARRVVVDFDKIKDYEKDKILTFEKLKIISDSFKWSSQSSGVEIPKNVADKLEKEWSLI